MKVMTVRDFLRGGYKTLTEPTLISKHGVPYFTVFPPFPAVRLAAGEGDRRESPKEAPPKDEGE